MNFLGQGFQKLEPKLDRQNHTQTDGHNQMHYHPTFPGGNNNAELARMSICRK